MHYRITLADALTAHDEALTYGGLQGITSLHLIESAIGRPYSGYYRSIFKKAAALLESMVGNHGFTDGNKRTAWLLVELLVRRNGYSLQIGEAERFDDFVVDVAAGLHDFAAVEDWFKAHIRKAR